MKYVPNSDPAYDMVRDALNDINARWAACACIRYAMDHLIDTPEFQEQVGMMAVDTIRLYNK